MMRGPTIHGLLTFSAYTASTVFLMTISMGAGQAQTAASPPTSPPASTPEHRSPSPAPRRAAPDDASAPVPPVVHRSALRPRSPDAVPVGSWSEANRVVDEVGGWKAYLKEAHNHPKGPEAAK
jgi:hypothetical protein